MRAVAVFPHAHEVKLIDVEEPQIARPTEVKLRMLDVGICGTDREISSFQYGTPPDGSDYLILGHESLGEVVEIGPAVQGISVGDLAVIMVRRPCPHAECHACRAGRSDFCVTGDFTERVTIAEKALSQALHIERRMPWLAEITPQSPERSELTAAILGAGAIGLLGAMALRAMDIETYVYDRVPPPNSKSQLVETIGARYISPENPSTSFTDLIGHVHFIYEATGVSQLAFQAIMALSPNSILVLTGVPGLGAHKELDTDTLKRNMVLQNQVILGTVNAGSVDHVSAIRHIKTFMERWPEVFDTIISGRYPLDAYRDLLLGQSSGIKNVLSFEPK